MPTATVTLYSHAPRSMGKFMAHLVGLSDNMWPTYSRFKHWSLLLHFDGDPEDEVWLCTLRRSSLGGSQKFSTGGEEIAYYCKKVSKQEHRIGKYAETFYSLGTVDITVEELKEMCKNNKCNGRKYNVFKRNCQDWTKDLCKRLNIWDRKGKQIRT